MISCHFIHNLCPHPFAPPPAAEVLVTHVDSPSEFYVTYVKDSKKLADVMEGVAQCCQPPQPVKRGSIKPGELSHRRG